MFTQLINLLIKKPIWSLSFLIVVIVTSFLQIQNFSLDASSESLSLDGDNNLELYLDTQKTFGSDESLLISYTSENSLIEPEQLINLRSFRDKLLEIDGVDSVISLLDVSLFQSPPLTLIELASDVYTIDNGKADLDYVENELKTSPLYASNLISKDLKTTALLIPLSADDPTVIIDDEILKKMIFDIRSTMDEYRNDATLFLGGIPMIRNDAISVSYTHLTLPTKA